MTTTPFGDQLEAGLSADELQTNAKTFRHIWFVQRFLLHCTDQFLQRATIPMSSFPFEEAPTAIGLLHAACDAHRKAYADILIEQLAENLADEQLVRILINTRDWLLEQPERVSAIALVAREAHRRCLTHDQSKLVPPEVSTFTAMTPKLAGSTYGSEEYKGFLREMQPALAHHYAHNRHHPEYFDEGIEGMTLIDVLEMLCDWAASSLRGKNGDFLASIGIQKERFGLSDGVVELLRVTYVDFLAGEYHRDPAEFQTQ